MKKDIKKKKFINKTYFDDMDQNLAKIYSLNCILFIDFKIKKFPRIFPYISKYWFILNYLEIMSTLIWDINYNVHCINDNIKNHNF